MAGALVVGLEAGNVQPGQFNLMMQVAHGAQVAGFSAALMALTCAMATVKIADRLAGLRIARYQLARDLSASAPD